MKNNLKFFIFPIVCLIYIYINYILVWGLGMGLADEIHAINEVKLELKTAFWILILYIALILFIKFLFSNIYVKILLFLIPYIWITFIVAISSADTVSLIMEYSKWYIVFSFLVMVILYIFAFAITIISLFNIPLRYNKMNEE